MSFEKIKKQLSPEKIKSEVEAIRNINLPSELEKWVQEYNKVGNRGSFIWKWFLKVEEKVRNPFFVRKKGKHETSTEFKFLVTMFLILLDDVADHYRNERLLKQLLIIPVSNESSINHNNLSEEEIDYVEFTQRIWERISNHINNSKSDTYLKESLRYNLLQAINSIYYDYLINENPQLINKTEAQIYSVPSMQVMIHFISNIMMIDNFDPKEYPTVTEIGWSTQKMMRIGNWLSTWEREIEVNDYTSGIFAYAIAERILSHEEILSLPTDKVIIAIKRSQIENELLLDWNKCYQHISKLIQKQTPPSLNGNRLLGNIKDILILEMISKHYK